MIIACSFPNCLATVEVPEPVSSSVKFTCRKHTKPSQDDVRFQTYQFDDRLLGSGTDPRVYETRKHDKAQKFKFPKNGRPRKDRLEKLKQTLQGSPNSEEILKILMKDHDTDGPHGV